MSIIDDPDNNIITQLLDNILQSIRTKHAHISGYIQQPTFGFQARPEWPEYELIIQGGKPAPAPNAILKMTVSNNKFSIFKYVPWLRARLDVGDGEPVEAYDQKAILQQSYDISDPDFDPERIIADLESIVKK